MLGQEHILDVPRYRVGSSLRWCHHTLQLPCTRIQAGYQVDELWVYSAEGQDSPKYISVHRVERLAEIHIGCQQPNAEVTQTLDEDPECQNAIYYGRLLGCET